MVWRDVAPGALTWHEPLVRVEAETADGRWVPAVRHDRPVDDQGWHVGITYLGKDKASGHRYAARWYDPHLGGSRRHRFVLVANAGRPETSGQAFD